MSANPWMPMSSAPKDGQIIEAVARYPEASSGFPVHLAWRDDLNPAGWYQHSKNAPLLMVPWAWRPRGAWPSERQMAELEQPTLVKPEAKPEWVDRVDFEPADKLDEVCSSRGAHLEAMGGHRWFLQFFHGDGTASAFWFTSRDLTKPRWEKREEGRA